MALSLLGGSANESIAGRLLSPPPILQLHDINHSLVTSHPSTRVFAHWQVVTYATGLTGTGSTTVSRTVGDPITLTRSAAVPLVNGTANFTEVLRIDYSQDELRIAFSLEPPLLNAPPLVTSIRVLPAAPSSLVVLHSPIGGLSCQPFALQPRVAVKDAFNNTVHTLPPLAVRASIAHEGIGLVGETSVALADGVGEFASLGINGSALGVHLHFELASPQLPPTMPPEPPSTPPLPGIPPPLETSSGDAGSGSDAGSGAGSGAGSDVGSGSGVLESGSAVDGPSLLPPPTPAAAPPPSAPPLSDTLSASLAVSLAAAVDCHGPPARIALLPGAPLAVHAVDAVGVRTTSISGAELRTHLLFADGSRRATNPPRVSTRGVWQFEHADDPLGLALTAGVTEVQLIANLTDYLVGPDPFGNATCCTLVVPRIDEPDESLLALFMPALSIVRLTARNSGSQGGYGLGDSIEVTFNRRTDRAGFDVGQPLTKMVLEELLVVEGSLGDDPQAYSGVWRDDCTLMLIAGNTTGATTPPIGVFNLRVRDDVHELRDRQRFLRVGSVAQSPTLWGTFGAATGLAGRTDPQRAMLPDLAARRYIPPAAATVTQLRRGPMSWHPTDQYDPDRDRTSECDVNYTQPDGLRGTPPPNSLPPYALDEATRALIRAAIARMANELPSGLPHTRPPRGLPTDPLHRHDDGDAPPPPPWTPSDARQQIDERAAAAAIGPNGQVQRYPLRLDAPEHRRAFGLEGSAREL